MVDCFESTQPINPINQLVLATFGDNYSPPYNNSFQPPDRTALTNEQLLQLQYPGGGKAKPTGLDTNQSISDYIAPIIGSLSSILSFFGPIYIILDVIRGIIDLICALFNPVPVVATFVEFFLNVVPPLIALYPPLSSILHALNAVKVIAAIAASFLAQVTAIIDLIVANALEIPDLISQGNLAAVEGINTKLCVLFQNFTNQIGAFAPVQFIIELVNLFTSLGSKFFCINESACCNSDNCPPILINPPAGIARLVQTNVRITLADVLGVYATAVEGPLNTIINFINDVIGGAILAIQSAVNAVNSTSTSIVQVILNILFALNNLLPFDFSSLILSLGGDPNDQGSINDVVSDILPGLSIDPASLQLSNVTVSPISSADNVVFVQDQSVLVMFRDEADSVPYLNRFPILRRSNNQIIEPVAAPTSLDRRSADLLKDNSFLGGVVEQSEDTVTTSSLEEDVAAISQETIQINSDSPEPPSREDSTVVGTPYLKAEIATLLNYLVEPSDIPTPQIDEENRASLRIRMQPLDFSGDPIGDEIIAPLVPIGEFNDLSFSATGGPDYDAFMARARALEGQDYLGVRIGSVGGGSTVRYVIEPDQPALLGLNLISLGCLDEISSVSEGIRALVNADVAAPTALGNPEAPDGLTPVTTRIDLDFPEPPVEPLGECLAEQIADPTVSQADCVSDVINDYLDNLSSYYDSILCVGASRVSSELEANKTSAIANERDSITVSLTINDLGGNNLLLGRLPNSTSEAQFFSTVGTVGPVFFDESTNSFKATITSPTPGKGQVTAAFLINDNVCMTPGNFDGFTVSDQVLDIEFIAEAGTFPRRRKQRIYKESAGGRRR